MTAPPDDSPVFWTSPSADPRWDADVQALFRYWRDIHPPSGLPGRQHFDPVAIKKLLPNVWLLDVQPEPFRLRYRLAGTNVTEHIGREVTGLLMEEAHPEVARNPAYLDRYREVVRRGVPSWRRGPPKLWIHKDFKIMENLILPLASDGKRVDMLLCFSVMH